MNKTSWLALALVTGLCMACSLKKTAEETASTTKEMNETTKDMRDTTSALESELTYKESHDQMMKHMDWLFMEAQRAEDHGIAGTVWETLFGLNNDPDLFIAGGGTILSMHFQFWKGDEDEDLPELDKRLELGSETLFDRLFKHVPRDLPVDVFRPDRSYRGVAALGAKLELVDERFKRGLDRRGLPQLTYYDFIVMALNHRAAFNRHPVFPRTVDKILQWEPEARYVLQLRHNILPVMVMARISDFQDRKDWGRFWLWMWGDQVDVRGANPAALREWISWLNKASQTRADLTAMGIAPEYNKVLSEMVAGIDFGQHEWLSGRAGPADVSDEKRALLLEFAAAYQRVQDEASAGLAAQGAAPAPPAPEEPLPEDPPASTDTYSAAL